MHMCLFFLFSPPFRNFHIVPAEQLLISRNKQRILKFLTNKEVEIFTFASITNNNVHKIEMKSEIIGI